MGKPRVTAKAILEDDGWQRILKAMTTDPDAELEVGLLDDDSAIAEYGFYNEFGTSTIPSRSFIRSTFDRFRNKYQKGLEDALNRGMLKGKAPSSALVKLGVRQRNDIIKTITKLKRPANAPSTIAAKGSSNPLIDDGIMRLAIRWRIVRLRTGTSFSEPAP